MTAAQNTTHSLPPGEAPRENLKTTTTTTVAQQGATLRTPKKSKALPLLKPRRKWTMVVKRTKPSSPAPTAVFSRMPR